MWLVQPDNSFWIIIFDALKNEDLILQNGFIIEIPGRSDLPGIFNAMGTNGLAEVLEIVAVLAAGEGGAVFVDAFEFTVAYDLDIRIIELQRAE